MRTCKNCGCYLPDNWTTCPACFVNENQPQEIKKIVYKEAKPRESLSFNVCRVDVFHKNYTKSSNVFTSYDNAIKFARLMACDSLVAIVLVVDLRSDKIIEKFSRKWY